MKNLKKNNYSFLPSKKVLSTAITAFSALALNLSIAPDLHAIDEITEDDSAVTVDDPGTSGAITMTVNDYEMVKATSGVITFSIVGSEEMRIKKGKIGIGTSYPTGTLHVNGGYVSNTTNITLQAASGAWESNSDGGHVILSAGYGDGTGKNGSVGVNTYWPSEGADLHVNNIIKLTPTDYPASCSTVGEGGMYFDDSLGEPCFCDGTNWTQFDGGGGC